MVARVRHMIPDGVEVIWFDLDDTLFDFRAASVHSLRVMYDRYGLGRYFDSPEHWADVYHRHNKELWQRYNAALTDKDTLRHDRFYLPLAEVGVDAGEAERLTAVMDVDYLDELGRYPGLIDGAGDLLRDLRLRGYRIGILSNGFTEVQHAKLRTIGLDGLVDYVVLSDEVGYNKPDVRIFRHAERLSGALPAQSLMVGDNPDTDIAGARRAGWHALLVQPGEETK